MILPLTNNPSETFSIEIFEVVYNMRQIWNSTAEFWSLDIADVNGVDIVAGVKIVALTNLLAQYIQLPFDLLSTTEIDPTRNNLNEFILEVVLK